MPATLPGASAKRTGRVCEAGKREARMDAEAQNGATQIWVFPSSLGFMALVQQHPTHGGSHVRQSVFRQQSVIRQLTIGHASLTDALLAVEPAWRFQADVLDEPNSLVERLQAYADGVNVEFHDVEVALDRASPFRRRVLAACRAIGAGNADLRRTGSGGGQSRRSPGRGHHHGHQSRGDHRPLPPRRSHQRPSRWLLRSRGADAQTSAAGAGKKRSGKNRSVDAGPGLTRRRLKLRLSMQITHFGWPGP